MLPRTILTPPSVADFTLLEEYQSQTPASFIAEKPVLHFQLRGAKATVPRAHCGTLAIFPADAASSAGGNANGAGEELVERTVDVFATSQHFIVFSQEAEAGVSIPYPSISIHAVKQLGSEADEKRTQAVWMQLELSDGGDDDDDFNTVELTIIPANSDDTPTAASQLYEAVATCSNLHPDPHDGDEMDDEDDRIFFEEAAGHEAVDGFEGVLQGSTNGGLPPPMPGSGGWITADNVHEHFDADGNYIGKGAQGEREYASEEEELGEGAGRTRARDEINGSETNGHSEDDPENKRARVD